MLVSRIPKYLGGGFFKAFLLLHNLNWLETAVVSIYVSPI